MAGAAEALWQLAYDLYAHDRWAKAGVLDRLFAELQREQLTRIKIEAVSLDSTIIKVHPDPKRSASPAAVGQPKLIWLPRVPRYAIRFSLSHGQAGDAPEGRALFHSIQGFRNSPILPPATCHLLMDCAYEGNETRQRALDLRFIPVVPPHPNAVEPWRLKKAPC